METIVLGFGSNAGIRLRNIKKAIKYLALNNDLDLLAVSQIYETEPWGFARQKNFLNCAAVFLCRLSPHELMEFIRHTEKKIGRITREKWRPREIDIDILFYGKRVLSGSDISVPHKYIAERNFVLKPLVELIPDFIHPLEKKSIAELNRNSVDKCKVKPVIKLF